MPSQYERALYRVGNDGLAIYIPKAWARFWQLKPGDTVVIIANDGLTIIPKTQPEKVETIDEIRKPGSIKAKMGSDLCL